MSFPLHRSDKAPHLLPNLQPKYDSSLSPASLDENLLFDNAKVLDLLSGTSLDEKRLTASVSSMKRRHSAQHSNSAMDINTISVEVDSACSSPGLPRVSLSAELCQKRRMECLKTTDVAL